MAKSETNIELIAHLSQLPVEVVRAVLNYADVVAYRNEANLQQLVDDLLDVECPN